MGRKLGQHFLTDPRILDRIVDAIDPQPDDIVIEIGAGKGSLTRRLAARVGTVVAVERDRDLAEELRRDFGRGEQGTGNGEGENKQTVHPDGPTSRRRDGQTARRPEGETARRPDSETARQPKGPTALPPYRPTALPPSVTIVHGDALELNWSEIIDENTVPRSPFPVPRFKAVGNIPYYITSPLIEKALTPPRPTVIVYLMQREVADRLVADPGRKTYGAISVGVRVVARVERLFTVKPGSFKPAPNVESAVVRFAPLESPLVGEDELAGFRRFVVGLFSQRRKQLARSLRSVVTAEKTDALAVLDRAGVEATERPESLSPGDFVRLFRALPR